MLVEPERPAVPGIDDAAAGRLARSWQEGRRDGKAMVAAGVPERIELPVALVRVGPWRWLHLLVELFASLGLSLRDEAPWPIRVVGYTDGYAAYVAARPATSR